MPSNINIMIGSFTATGETRNVPQYKIPIGLQWTGDDGEVHEHQQIVTFPDNLALLPQAWVAQAFNVIAVEGLRKYLGLPPGVALD